MINPWVLAAMVPAMVILMLHLAIGPFGHMKFIHWHLRWKQQSATRQRLLLSIAILVLLSGASHLLGLWSFAGAGSPP